MATTIINPYRFAGGAGAWTPNDLTDIWMWLSAQDNSECWEDTSGTDACEDGDFVKRWGDRTGNGHDFSQASIPPVWNESGKYIDFQAHGDRLDSTESLGTYKFMHNGGSTPWLICISIFFDGTNPNDLQAVFGTSNSTGVRGFGIHMDDRSSVPRNMHGWQWTTKGVGGQYLYNSGDLSNDFWAGNTWNILTVSFDDDANNTRKVRLNGTEVRSHSRSYTPSTSNENYACDIGAVNGVWNMDGRIGDIVIVNGSIPSSGDIDTLEQYVSDNVGGPL